MQVSRLRLAGFKSFVDVTELAIEPGLTGIVGPNGWTEVTVKLNFFSRFLEQV